MIVTSSLISSYSLAAGNPQQGKEKSKTCLACHNSKLSDSYLVQGENEGYIINALTAYKKQIFVEPTMRSVAYFMSDQDIADIAAYFSSVPRHEKQSTPD